MDMENNTEAAISVDLSVHRNDEAIDGRVDCIVGTTGSSNAAITSEVLTEHIYIDDDTASPSIRDGPALEEQVMFDPSSMPMLTTSPSKHGSNLNEYIDVCHSWIDAEIHTQNSSKPPISLQLEEIPVSPVYRCETDGNEGDVTDEEGEEEDSPVSLNCSSDSSTGPPPPPPPPLLVPLIESEIQHSEDFEGMVDPLETTVGSPFDEVTVAEEANEIDTALDAVSPVDGGLTMNSQSFNHETNNTVEHKLFMAPAGIATLTISTPILGDENTLHEQILPNESTDHSVFCADGSRSNRDDAVHEAEETDISIGLNDANETQSEHSTMDTGTSPMTMGEENTEFVEERIDEAESFVAWTPSKAEHEPSPFDEVTEAPQDNLDTTIDTVTLTNETDALPPILDKADVAIQQQSDELMVETNIHDTIFLGDMESPHDMEPSPKSDVPFLGNIMSPSAENEFKHPLDEEILSMSPKELEAYVHYIKSNSDTSNKKNELELSSKSPCGVSLSFVTIEEESLPNDTGPIELPVPREAHTLEAKGKCLFPSAIAPDKACSADDNFTIHIASNVAVATNEAVGINDLVASSNIDRPLDEYSSMDKETNKVPVEPELKVVSVETSDAPSSQGTNKIQTITNMPQETNDSIHSSRYTVINQELESIDHLIENTPKLDELENVDALEDFDKIKKKPITESDIFFEHLWKETANEMNSSVGTGTFEMESINNQKGSTSPNVCGSKNHVVSGNMDFLSTRKGSAYVDYAKRSAHKFQKAKEDILNCDELEKAATLSLAGGDMAQSEASPFVTVDVTDDADLASPMISPASENEIVRVPTIEETKASPAKAESVTTSCMDTCAVM